MTYLCGVNGIGPRLAMTTLSGLTGDLLVNAINSQDESAFRSIPGIGPKTAKLGIDHLERQGGVVLKRHGSMKTFCRRCFNWGGDEIASRKLLSSLDQSLSESALLKLALAELGRSKLTS